MPTSKAISSEREREIRDKIYEVAGNPPDKLILQANIRNKDHIIKSSEFWANIIALFAIGAPAVEFFAKLAPQATVEDMVIKNAVSLFLALKFYSYVTSRATEYKEILEQELRKSQ